MSERVATYFPNEVGGGRTPSSISGGSGGMPSLFPGGSSPKGSGLGVRKRAVVPNSGGSHTNSMEKKAAAAVVMERGQAAWSENRVWKMLFSNTNRSVDELYYLCEEEGNEEKCREAIVFLERAGRDFEKLIERMSEQRKFESDQSAGVCWEVRKPTGLSFLPEGSDGINALDSPKRERMEREELLKKNSKLRAIAAPFQPSIMKSQDASDAPSVLPSTPAHAQAPATEEVATATVETKTLLQQQSLPSPLALASTSLTIETDAPPSSPIPSPKSIRAPSTPPLSTSSSSPIAALAISSGREKTEAALIPKKRPIVIGSPTRNKSEGEWDFEAQVVLESERVWAEAEAWVEAEAAAEEAAWLILQEEVHAHRGGINKHKHSSCLSNWSSSNHEAFKEGESDDGLTELRNNTKQSRDVPPSSIRNQLTSPSSSPSGKSTSDSYVMTPLESGSVGSSSNTNTPHSGSAMGRSLHAKLSSPDRRRALSPTEAKRRHEARQSAAESNRDRTVAERKQKAMIASNRVKARNEKEEKRIAQAQQDIMDRLTDAEKRHGEHIKNIRGKAGNENAKVSEVMFINNLNGEGIAEELQRRLEDVEARILAAGQRRQERLSGLSLQQKKKNSRKSQQMSALRLQLERQKMERWEKLQQRLDAVQKRREARIAELQRRSDEQAALGVVPPCESHVDSPIVPTPHAFESSTTSQGERENEEEQLAARSHLQLREEVEKRLFDGASDKKKKKKKKKRKALVAQNLLDEASSATNCSDDFENRPAALGNRMGGASLTIEPGMPLAAFDKSSGAAAIEWVGPGGLEDPGRDNELASSTFRVWQASVAKRTPAQARTSALSQTFPDEDLSTSTSSWPARFAALRSIFFSLANWIKAKAVDSATSPVATLAYQFARELWPAPDSPASVLLLDIGEGEVPLLSRTGMNALCGEFSRVNQQDPSSIESFVFNGGVLLLRIYFGEELGVLSSPEVFDVEFRSASFVNAVKLLSSICRPGIESTYKGEVLACGLGVLLADCCHIFILQVGTWLRYVRTHRSSESLAMASSASNNSSSKLDPTALNEKEYFVAAKGKPRTWIEADASSLPTLLLTLECLSTASTLVSDSLSRADEKRDALLWYMFASGLPSISSHTLRSLQFLGVELCFDPFLKEIICRLAGLICAMGTKLHFNGGLTCASMVQSMSQFGPRKDAHARGKEMTSLLRTSEICTSLVILLEAIHLSPRSSSSSMVATIAFGASTAIIRTLCILATVDLGLVQNLAEEPKRSMLQSVFQLLKMLLAVTETDARPSLPTSSIESIDLADFDASHAGLAIAQILSLFGLACLKWTDFQSHFTKIQPNASSESQLAPSLPLLVSLCRIMPVRYYADEKFKIQLLPTLASICLDNPEGQTLLRRELVPSLIGTHFARLSRELEDNKREATSPNTVLCVTSARFPVDLWQEALSQFA